MAQKQHLPIRYYLWADDGAWAGNLSPEQSLTFGFAGSQALRLRTIQESMGHRKFGATARYRDVSDETMRNAVERV